MSSHHSAMGCRVKAEARARSLVNTLPQKWKFKLHCDVLCQEDPVLFLNVAQHAEIIAIEDMHHALIGNLVDATVLTYRLRNALWKQWEELHPNDKDLLKSAKCRFVVFLASFRNCCRQRKNRAPKSMCKLPSILCDVDLRSCTYQHIGTTNNDTPNQSADNTNSVYSVDEDYTDWGEDALHGDESWPTNQDMVDILSASSSSTAPPEEPMDWIEWI